MKQKLGILTPVSSNTYKDARGRTIYGDLKKQTAYIIEKSDLRTYELMSNRYILSLSLGVIIGYAFNWTVGIVLAFVGISALEYYFKGHFLPKCVSVDEVEFPKKATTKDRMATKDTKQLYIVAVLSLILPALVYANLKMTAGENDIIAYAFEGTNPLLMTLVSAAVIVFSLYLFWISYEEIQARNKAK